MAIYLKLKGSKSGAINGGVTTKGQEGAIAVNAVQHSFNHASAGPVLIGASTGGLGPLSIEKVIDKSSPLLYRLLDTAETLTATLDFWLPQTGTVVGNATMFKAYTITLANALVTGVNLKVLDMLDPATHSRPPTETVVFSYGTITWTWNEGGVTASASH